MIKKWYLKTALTISFSVVFLMPFSLSYADSFTVNVPDAHGGYMALVIQSSGNGYIGPRGEFYARFPSVSQLQSVYVLVAPAPSDQVQAQASSQRATAASRPFVLNKKMLWGAVIFLLCMVTAGALFYWVPALALIWRKQMNAKPTLLPKISSGLFGLIILSFLLPWCTVSCNHMQVVSFTGMDLSVGKEIPSGMFGETRKVQEALVVIAWLTGFLGVLTGFLLKGKVVDALQAVWGWAGGVLLCVLKVKWDKEAMAQGGGAIIVDYHFGFWAALLLFFGIGLVSILSLMSCWIK